MFEHVLDIITIDAFDLIILDDLKVPDRLEFDRVVIHGGQPDMNVIDPLVITADLEAEAIGTPDQMLGACHGDELATTKLLKDRLGNRQVRHGVLPFDFL